MRLGAQVLVGQKGGWENWGAWYWLLYWMGPSLHGLWGLVLGAWHGPCRLVGRSCVGWPCLPHVRLGSYYACVGCCCCCLGVLDSNVLGALPDDQSWLQHGPLHACLHGPLRYRR